MTTHLASGRDTERSKKRNGETDAGNLVMVKNYIWTESVKTDTVMHIKSRYENGPGFTRED